MRHEHDAQPEGRPESSPPARDDDGVDVSLIHWMLSLTPEQRLEVLQAQVRSLTELRRVVGKQL